MGFRILWLHAKTLLRKFSYVLLVLISIAIFVIVALRRGDIEQFFESIATSVTYNLRNCFYIIYFFL